MRPAGCRRTLVPLPTTFPQCLALVAGLCCLAGFCSLRVVWSQDFAAQKVEYIRGLLFYFFPFPFVALLRSGGSCFFALYFGPACIGLGLVPLFRFAFATNQHGAQAFRRVPSSLLSRFSLSFSRPLLAFSASLLFAALGGRGCGVNSAGVLSNGGHLLE